MAVPTSTITAGRAGVAEPIDGHGVDQPVDAHHVRPFEPHFQRQVARGQAA